MEHPDSIEEILVNIKSLPKGKYHHVGYESRQVFDIEMNLSVTEFRAEIVADEYDVEFTANFPKGVTEIAQYGNTVKANSVYMSQFQLIPLARVENYFADQIGLPVSKGSISNFKILAARKLSWFDEWAVDQLIKAPVLNADETGINISGKGHWLHCLSNEKVTLFHVDAKRGQEAMENMGVLPEFRGILVHDHWKPYFNYDCDHSLCNAHHLRELERAFEQDGQRWAKEMTDLLYLINKTTAEAGGELTPKDIRHFKKEYRKIIKKGNIECPRNSKNRAQTKSRNLLQRMEKFETAVLRFMKDKLVPFTNNRGENDIRMTVIPDMVRAIYCSADQYRLV